MNPHLGAVVPVLLLAMLLSGSALFATEQACFNWSRGADGTLNFDASASVPGPGDHVYVYSWNFGDGNGGFTGVATISHTYPSPPPYDSTVRLQVIYSPSWNAPSVSCDTWPWVYPSGIQPPSSGTCCSS